MKRKHLVLVFATVLAVGLGVFAAGCGGILASSATTQTSTQQSQNQNGTTPSTAAQGQAQPGKGQRPGLLGGRLLAGTITASDASSVTIKTAAGGTQTVALSGSTKITVTRDGTAADLVAGKTVAVLVAQDANNIMSASQVRVGVTLPQGQSSRGQGQLPGRGRRVPGMMRSNVVYGTITASDASSLTVQTTNAGTQTIPLTTSTKIVVTSDGTAADLTVGQNVTILAARGANNDLTAVRVQVGVSLSQARMQGMPQGRGRLVPPNGNGRFRGYGTPQGGYMAPGYQGAPQSGTGI